MYQRKSPVGKGATSLSQPPSQDTSGSLDELKQVLGEVRQVLGELKNLKVKQKQQLEEQKDAFGDFMRQLKEQHLRGPGQEEPQGASGGSVPPEQPDSAEISLTDTGADNTANCAQEENDESDSKPPVKKLKGLIGADKMLDEGFSFLPSSSPLAELVKSCNADYSTTESCPICLNELRGASIYKGEDDDETRGVLAQFSRCRHLMHDACLREMLKKSSTFVQCPQCMAVYGEKVGNQPLNATMSHRVLRQSLPGYPRRVNTIEIVYRCKPGIQGPEHPNPGLHFHCQAFPRIAYLPDDDKGRKVLRLLTKAFNQRLIFTVGRSVTSGADNVVTWNDIHHKTQNFPGGEYGFPDENYLDNVMEDLAKHGITE